MSEESGRAPARGGGAERAMPWTLRGYVGATVLVAAMSLWTADWAVVSREPVTVLLLTLLAGLVGGRPVRIPSLKTELTATHPFIFCALVAVGPAASLVASLAGGMGATLVHHRRARWLRTVFNLANLVVSARVAAGVFALLGGRAHGAVLESLLPLGAAGAAYFLVNTGLVAVAIGLEKRQPLVATWRGSFPWTAASFFTGYTVAVLMALLLETLGPWSLALGVPPSWMLLAFYRLYRERVEEQERRLREAETLNAELEMKVAERTRELRDALGWLEDVNLRLRHTNERLQQANQAKSEFLAKVSHELRTPLNAIIGFSELLEDPSFGELREAQRGFVRDIRDSGEHLLELINDILDLSKIESGRMKVHKVPVNLRDLCRDVVAMMRPLADKKRLDVRSDVEPALAPAHVDRGMARQVLVNLLSNAVKFTPEGGRVVVRARREAACLVLEVEDTGIGIDPEAQRRIFQEFYQVDGSYSRQYQGTGLGLALVRSMVGLHGGDVQVRSAPGRGSCFTCRFQDAFVAPTESVPEEAKAPQTPARPEDSPAPERPRRAGARILVVEDQPLNRKLVRNALRSRGYDVQEAAEGRAALDAARAERPDLILMDLSLPGRDGFEVTRALKSDPATRDIPVVALTAHASPDECRRALEAGCAGCIHKPIRLARFPGEVASYLPAQEGAA